MPELPEVETARRALTRWAVGRPVTEVIVRDGRSIRRARTTRPSEGDPEGPARLAAVVHSGPAGPVERRGKRLLWRFPGGALLLHLGMTGKWTRQDGPHVKVGLGLPDGPVFFSDPRLLGGVVPTSLEAGPALLAEGLGPDAWLDPLPRLTGRRAVKVALMDQAVVAGLGNLHAAEALWRAGIHPSLPCDALDDDAHARLADAVREQLRFALELQGDDDEIQYVEDAGAPNPFPLYGQKDRPCPRCGASIARFVQGGRTTWWCPGCQPAP